MKHALRSGGFCVALECQHQPVAVDDARGRRQQRRDAGKRRLERPRLGPGEQFEVIDSIDPGLVADIVQDRVLLLAGGDDQLAEAFVCHAAFVAIGIQHLPPLDAQSRLKAACRVIDACVDDFRVACAGTRADPLGSLDDHDLAA